MRDDIKDRIECMEEAEQKEAKGSKTGIGKSGCTLNETTSHHRLQSCFCLFVLGFFRGVGARHEIINWYR